MSILKTYRHTTAVDVDGQRLRFTSYKEETFWKLRGCFHCEANTGWFEKRKCTQFMSSFLYLLHHPRTLHYVHYRTMSYA